MLIIPAPAVIPAKAGIQDLMDPRLREDDGYLSFPAIFPSILNLLAI
jgi:hypothetical protein